MHLIPNTSQWYPGDVPKIQQNYFLECNQRYHIQDHDSNSLDIHNIQQTNFIISSVNVRKLFLTAIDTLCYYLWDLLVFGIEK